MASKTENLSNKPVKEIFVEKGVVVGQSLSQSGKSCCRDLFQRGLVGLVPGKIMNAYVCYMLFELRLVF